MAAAPGVTADFPAVKRRYHALALEHHPDRGGDGDTLREINAAMAVLQKCYRGKRA